MTSKKKKSSIQARLYSITIKNMSLQKEIEWEGKVNELVAYAVGGECGGRTVDDCKKELLGAISNREQEIAEEEQSKGNFLSNEIAKEVIKAERIRIAEEVKKMKYTHEQIKDIGLAWQGHPCVGANDALDKVLSILKHNQ